MRALQSTEVSMMGELQKIHEKPVRWAGLARPTGRLLYSHMAELSHRALAAQEASRRLQARMLSGLDIDPTSSKTCRCNPRKSRSNRSCSARSRLWRT